MNWINDKLKGWKSITLALAPIITVLAAQFGIVINVEDLVDTLTNHYGKIATIYGGLSIWVRSVTIGEDGLSGLLKRIIGNG